MKTTPRPRQHDDAVIEKAIDRLLPAVLKHLDINPSSTDPDDLDYIKDCRNDLIKSADDDGYAFARNLDHKSWDPDAELVDILDSYGTYLYAARQEAVKAWVKEVNPQPLYTVGTKVRYKRDMYGSDWVDATIAEIRTETAEYVINSTQLHGLSHGGSVHTMGDIVPFEHVHLQRVEPAEAT